MGTSEISVGEFLYDAVVNFTKITEYGVSMDALLAGRAAPPLAGARFDIAFEAVLRGPRLNGRAVGVDYIRVRADGRFELHIHAQITTDDGQNIAFFADGVAVPQEGTAIARLRENVSFITASPGYAWLNQLQVWAQGVINLEKGEVKVKAYVA